MRSLLTGDLHLSSNRRDSYRFKFFRRLPALARKYECAAVILNGDLTEEKDRHNSELVNMVADGVHDIAAVCPVIVNKGNHDYVDVESPFFAFLRRIRGVTWVGTPLPAKNLPSAPLASLRRTLILPHSPDPATEWAKLDVSRYRRIIAHQMFTGANIGFGRKGEGFDPAFFPDHWVFSGDVHVPQRFDVETSGVGTHVVYCGAPYTVDFGDDYEGRFILLNVNDQWESVRVGGPQKRLIEFSATSNDADVLKSVEACNRGDVVKIRVFLDNSNVNTFPAVKKIMLDWAVEAGVELNAIVPIHEGITPKRSMKDDASRRSDDELVQAYVKKQGAAKSYLKTGRIIMEQV